MRAQCPQCGGQVVEEYPAWVIVTGIVLVVFSLFTAGLSLLGLAVLWLWYRSNRYWKCKVCGYTFPPG